MHGRSHRLNIIYIYFFSSFTFFFAAFFFYIRILLFCHSRALFRLLYLLRIRNVFFFVADFDILNEIGQNVLNVSFISSFFCFLNIWNKISAIYKYFWMQSFVIWYLLKDILFAKKNEKKKFQITITQWE